MCGLSGRRTIHTCGSRSLFSPDPAGTYDKECDPVEKESSVFSGGITFCTDNTRILKMAVTSASDLMSQPFLVFREGMIFHSRQVLDRIKKAGDNK